MESFTLPPPQAEFRNPAEEDRRRIARFRAGDANAFDEIVRAHQKQVEGLAFRLLGDSDGLDDVVQDVFVTAFTGLRRFRGESQLSTWLTRIAINRCRSAIRRRRIFGRAMAWFRGRVADAYETSDAGESAETAARVRRAVYDLAEKYRVPIVLRYFENRSIAEIADLLAIAPGAVEVRLTRARQKLKTILGEQSQ